MLNISKHLRYMNRNYKSKKEITVKEPMTTNDMDYDDFEEKWWDRDRWVRFEVIRNGVPTGIYMFATDKGEYENMTKSEMFREC